jgi:hypothetical protein
MKPSARSGAQEPGPRKNPVEHVMCLDACCTQNSLMCLCFFTLFAVRCMEVLFEVSSQKADLERWTLASHGAGGPESRRSVNAPRDANTQYSVLGIQFFAGNQASCRRALIRYV